VCGVSPALQSLNLGQLYGQFDPVRWVQLKQVQSDLGCMVHAALRSLQSDMPCKLLPTRQLNSLTVCTTVKRAILLHLC
jgi:hypothetical protein